MKNFFIYVISLLQNIRLYWSIKRRLSIVKHNFYNFLLLIKNDFEKWKLKRNILVNIFFFSLKSIVFAFLICVLILEIWFVFHILTIHNFINYIFLIIPKSDSNFYDNIIIITITIASLFSHLILYKSKHYSWNFILKIAKQIT